MNDTFKMLVDFFVYTFIALGAQNVIFTRALGLSSGIRMLRDSKKNIFYFCGAMTVFQLMTSLMVHFGMPLIEAGGFGEYRRFILPTVIVIACTLSYVIVIAILRTVLSSKKFGEIIQSVTGASITGTIVGTVILSEYQGLSLVQKIGFGFGSSVGYFLAMLLIIEGAGKLDNENIPKPFRGLPITLAYISVLALAIYGLTGHGVA